MVIFKHKYWEMVKLSHLMKTKGDWICPWHLNSFPPQFCIQEPLWSKALELWHRTHPLLVVSEAPTTWNHIWWPAWVQPTVLLTRHHYMIWVCLSSIPLALLAALCSSRTYCQPREPHIFLLLFMMVLLPVVGQEATIVFSCWHHPA